MNLSDIEKYYKKLNEFGYDFDDPRHLGWKNLEHQENNWDNLLSHVKKYDSILDWGSGFGLMLPYIRKYGLMGSYDGLECRKYCVVVSNKLFKKPFLLGTEPIKKYDWIISSGLFKVGYTKEDIIEKIKKMNEKSMNGFSFNITETETISIDIMEEIKRYCFDSFSNYHLEIIEDTKYNTHNIIILKKEKNYL